MSKTKSILVLSLVAVSILISCVALFMQSSTDKHDGLREFPRLPSIPLSFCPRKLTQGCDGGDLPFHYFRHPDLPQENCRKNLGISSCTEFIRWVGMGSPLEIEFEYPSEIIEGREIFLLVRDPLMDPKFDVFEKKGLDAVRRGGLKELKGYATILAHYYFFSARDTKAGLTWALKGAKLGETGSMVLLGDAYSDGYGVVLDEVEGLMWYIIGSALGDLAAQGRMLALTVCPPREDKDAFRKNLKLAQERARVWQDEHPENFFCENFS